MLREPCRVSRVYGTPLLNGEFLFAPVTREYSVQMFLEGVEDGEKPVFILYVLILLRKCSLCIGWIYIKTFFLVYS